MNAHHLSMALVALVAEWTTDDLAAKPRCWMHQPGSLTEERMLDSDTFAAQANATLRER